MNVDNINTLIQTFERLYHAPLPEHPDKGFTMEHHKFTNIKDQSKHDCGTAACILGWNELLFKSERAFRLSLTNHNALFYPGEKSAIYDFVPMNLCFISTPKIFTLPAAIRVLELLIEHETMVDPDNGRNMWERAIREQHQVIDRLEAARKPAKIDWIVELQKPVLDLPEYERAVRELGKEWREKI